MTKVVLGVDIGHETVKLASLEHTGHRFRLQGMKLSKIPIGCWKPDSLTNIDEIAKVINESISQASPHRINARRIAIALPESVIFSATLSLPRLNDAELEKALPYELAERLSLNPEEYHVDFEKVSSKCVPISQSTVIKTDSLSAKKDKDKELEKVAESKPKPVEVPTVDQQIVFAVATKKTLIESVVELCEKTRLELVAIDIKPGAIIRSVIPGDDLKARVVIDMGVGGSGISVAEGHSLRVTSTVPWGTHAIAQTITGPVEGLREKIAPVLDELVHITKFFENRVCPGLRIEQVIISGTGASIPDIAGIFQQETGLPSVLAEPFKNIDTHSFAVPVELRHTFADAIGLAMRTDD